MYISINSTKIIIIHSLYSNFVIKMLHMLQKYQSFVMGGRRQIGQIPSLGPVVESVVSLTSSLRVISLTVLADSIYNYSEIFC